MNDPSPAADSRESRIHNAIQQYVEGVDRGEPIDREAFIAAHPDAADELRSFIATDEQLRRMAGTERAPDRSVSSTQSFALQGQETIAPQNRKMDPSESGSGLRGQFGRYRIVRALGQGAMGAVYLAEDTQLERQIALKTPHFAQTPTPELLERFYREARSAATLRHPNICPVYDVDQINGTHYISMAYIEGHPLSAFVRTKPQPERQILIVIRKLAQALQEAHEHGIVHRDLKPANIMVDKRNEPIIMDFGLARRTQRQENVRITQSGMLIGTPAYMSPEQIDGEPDKIGPATDQYSLGVILYELLTGQLPFRGSLTGVLAQILTKAPTPLSQLRPGLNPRIEAVCTKMMAKNPAGRFSSLAAVAEELASILRTPTAAPKSTDSGTSQRSSAVAPEVPPSAIKKSVATKDLSALRSALDAQQQAELPRRTTAGARIPRPAALGERRGHRRWTFWIALAGVLAILGVVCGVTIIVKLGPNTVRVDAQNPDVQVAVKGTQVIVSVPNTETATKQPPGDAGETRPERPPIKASPKSEFTSLFNGKDLTGWKIDPRQPGNWRVENGVLIGSGPEKRSHLYTVRGDFKDFHLRVEARINTGGNSGVYFRSTLGPGWPVDHPVWPYGYEAQIDSTLDPNRTGSLYAGTFGAVVGVTDAPAAGEWFVEEVIATGYHFIIKINGVTTVDYRDAKQISAIGHLALQQNNPNTVAEFRKIEIHEFAPDEIGDADTAHTLTAPLAAVSPDGFVSLFNGKDLTGWITDPRQPGQWTVQNGAITGGGPSGSSFLYSRRGDYKDFHLRVEARLQGDAFSGLCFRTEIPAADAQFPSPTAGYVVDLREPDDAASNRTGAVWAFGTGARTGFNHLERLVQPGQWFTVDVIAEGRHTVVMINGRTALDNRWVKKSFLAGHIALEQHPGKPSVEFRKIEIKELPASNSQVAAAKTVPSVRGPADEGLLVAPFGAAEAKKAQLDWAARLGADMEVTNSIGMRLRLIPPGRFLMGSDDGAQFVGPAHSVRLTRPFYFGTCEVTKSEFGKFVAGNHQFKTQAERSKGGWHLENSKSRVVHEAKRRFTWQSPGFPQESSHPVVDVSWDDAQAFCVWLSRKEGRAYRLPTEAEWEYACRAGTVTPRYNGKDVERLTEIGNVADGTCNVRFPEWPTVRSSDGFVYTSPVGQFRPNNFGLYDTLGNALEWCSDWYASDYYSNSPDADPPGASGGTMHVTRGGSFAHIPDAVGRWHSHSDHHTPDLGFRVVCEIPPGPSSRTQKGVK